MLDTEFDDARFDQFVHLRQLSKRAMDRDCGEVQSKQCSGDIPTETGGDASSARRNVSDFLLHQAQEVLG